MSYVDKYGVRFSDDKKILEHCPENFAGEYVIPDGVTEIKMFAFEGCTELTSIKIPNSVVLIGEFAFNKCSNLKIVLIDSATIDIKHYAFSPKYENTRTTYDRYGDPQTITYSDGFCHVYQNGKCIDEQILSINWKYDERVQAEKEAWEENNKWGTYCLYEGEYDPNGDDWDW